ncbi:MAG TPA: AraC family transcriptional regulator [Puia sp.]|nr:AraC family transcriptional regulator [Puia sp.]
MPITPETYRKIITAKWYMDKNFHEPIDLDRLSREACLSRYHFHRLFTRIYRQTPHQYLTQKRIRQARQWLTEKELSISDICNNVGFESIGSFSALFKKVSGFAPQFYRRKALIREKEVRQQPRSFIPQCFLFAPRGSSEIQPPAVFPPPQQ